MCRPRCVPILPHFASPPGGADSDASGDHQTVRTARTGRTGMTEGPRTKAQRKPAEANKRLPASRPGGDPVDLLDRQATRQLAGASKPRRQQPADDGIEFETNASGKMIIKVGGDGRGSGEGVAAASSAMRRRWQTQVCPGVTVIRSGREEPFIASPIGAG